MNVLFIHERAVPGGAETRLLMHARSLIARGHRVFAACSPESLATRFAATGVEVLDVGGRWPLSGVEEIGTLRRLLREHEIAFCDVHALLSLWPGGLAALCEGVPFALNLHGLHTDEERVLLRTALSVLMPWAAWTAVNAPSTATHFARTFNVRPEALRCVPNAVDDVALRRLPPAQHPPRRLLVLSRLDEDKVQSLNAAGRFVVELGRRTPGISLRVAGGGNAVEGYRREWEPRFADAGVRVEWTGPTAEAEQEIAKSDVVLGLGRVALEGMAAGRPVVLCGVQGNLAGLCSRDNVDLWFSSNLNGRNAGEQEASQVVNDLLRISPEHTEQLASWVSAKAGSASIDAWALEVEAGSTRPLGQAARSAGEAAVAVFAEYSRLLQRCVESEARAQECERRRQECSAARAAESEHFERARREYSRAGEQIIQRYYLLLDSMRAATRFPPQPLRFLRELRRIRGEHAPEMRSAIARFKSSVKDG